eukprot:2791521-Alexandrium_andersonii.AAC.1
MVWSLSKANEAGPSPMSWANNGLRWRARVSADTRHQWTRHGNTSRSSSDSTPLKAEDGSRRSPRRRARDG